MPAWPGGPCPGCGEDMPENLIHCQACRTLLNDELDPDSIHIPEFIPLQELDSMIEVTPVGYYVVCPSCDQELRINKKYAGKNVQCKLCESPLHFDVDGTATRPKAFFANCPHCDKELRAALKYMGSKAACKHCDGAIHFVMETVH